jgi:hypothetical protein
VLISVTETPNVLAATEGLSETAPVSLIALAKDWAELTASVPVAVSFALLAKDWAEESESVPVAASVEVL